MAKPLSASAEREVRKSWLEPFTRNPDCMNAHSERGAGTMARIWATLDREREARTKLLRRAAEMRCQEPIRCHHCKGWSVETDGSGCPTCGGEGVLFCGKCLPCQAREVTG